MQVSSQIQLPSEFAVSPSSTGRASDNGQFAGLVSANSPQYGASRPTARPSDTRQSGGSQPHRPEPNTSQPGASQRGGPPEKALADDSGGTLQSEQPATAVVRGAEEAHDKPAQGRPIVAGDVPPGGKGLPVVGEGADDPALAVDGDTGETAQGEADPSAEVITLVAEVDILLVAPAVSAVQGESQVPAIASDTDPALTDGDEAAASGDNPETPAASARLRSDAAPRPGELDQLRGGRAQDLAWEQTQQTTLALSRQPTSNTAKPSLGDVTLAPDAGKDAREGASTAQLLASAGAGENSDLKSLKDLREARLAASSAAVAAKVAPAEGTSPSLVDTGSAARSGSTPVHPTGAAPSGLTDTSLAQLVDRLIETRVAARSERSHIELTHPDFGRVTLAVGLRGDDRLSVDLPGAPNELRHAVGQALAQASAAQSSGQNSGQNTGNNGNQSANQRAEGQGQPALAGGENSQNSAGHNGDPRRNTEEPDNAHLSIFAQSQAAGSDSGASRSAGGPASGGRRGVLA